MQLRNCDNGLKSHSKQPPTGFKATYQQVEVLSKADSRKYIDHSDTVYLVKKLIDESYYVCKRTKLIDMDKREQQSLHNEITLLQNMRHPNIIKLYEVYNEGDFMYCVQEYCEEGDLAHHIKRQSKKGEFFSQQIVESWVLQILLALEYIHNLKVVHRDIKASNVFLTSTGNIKIGSFELSKTLQTDRFAMTFAGTPCYMSPEILENKSYDFKTDIWSLGCLIFELCALRSAFSTANLLQLANKIIKSEPDYSIPSHYSRNLVDIIKKCLSKRSADRPSARELLRTQFFLSVMEKFISKNGLVSEKEQKIPIKKYGIHNKIKPKTPTSSSLSKKKLVANHVSIELKADKKEPPKKLDKKISKTPVIEAKSNQNCLSKNQRRNNSHEKRKSVEKLNKSVDKTDKSTGTPQTVGKTQGKKVPMPTIPKCLIKKVPHLTRSHDISKEMEEVSRSVHSQIQQPSKQYTSESVEENQEKPCASENWIDNEDIDYSISMTKKNLAAQLQSFKKHKTETESQKLQDGYTPVKSNLFQSLVVRQEDDTQLDPASDTEILDANRLTMTGDELPELLTQYKSKMQEVIQQLNYRYGPNMQIIAQRTNEFDSNEFAKQKVELESPINNK